VKFVQLYLGCLILTFLDLDLSNKTLFVPVNFYVGNYMMFPKILIGFFRNSYDTMLFQIRLFHFGITTRHLLKMGLETIQIIVNLPIELVNAPQAPL
jgi:catalase